MRISVDAKELSKVLSRAQKFAPTGNVVLPVLQTLKLAVKGSVLEVSATNMTSHATGRLNGEDAEDGTVLVSAKLLASLAQSLTAEVKLHLDGSSLKVLAGKAKYSLAVQADPEQFPIQGAPEADATRIEVDGDELSSALAAVVFAASKDETRPVLMGVHFSRAKQGDALHLLATDGVRASQATVPAAGVPEGLSLTVPAAALRRLPLEGGPVVLIPSETSLYIQAGGWDYRIALLEGNYPEVARLLPQEVSVKAVLRTNRQGLRQAASRLSVLEAPNVRLAIEKGSGELVLTSNVPEIGNAHEAMEVGEDWRDQEETKLEVALNPAFLAQALETLEEDQVEMWMVSSHHPIILVGRARRHDILPVVVG